MAGFDGLDAVLLASLVALTAATLAILARAEVPVRVVAPSLDLALDSVALVVTSIVATLAWIRYRERRNAFALCQTAAFLVLAITYLRAVIDTVGTDPTAPLATSEPGQEQLYVFIAGRLTAAALLVVGGVAALRGARERHVAAFAGLSIGFILVVVALAHPAAHVLPALINVGERAIGGRPAMTPLGAGLQLTGAVLFLGSVIVSRRLWRRDGSIGDAYVSGALLFGAFALVLGAIAPGTHPGPVTIADLLWLGFNIGLLLAVEAEARALLGALRRANITLEELGAAEVARAGLEERSRLSRELHDGLTQDLWLAKLKVGRLAGLEGLEPAARKLIDEARGAIDQGLAEAHQAVLAMRIAGATDGAFCQLLTRYSEDFEDRFGLRVQVECASDIPQLPVRTQAELLRIAQEALANVHRHAAARRVEVRVRASADEIVLAVSDDGCGFVVGEPGATDFGLLAMRERAALIGGSLRIDSRPGEGTHVEVSAPLAPPRVAADDVRQQAERTTAASRAGPRP
jgi:signal transduction histidine kinase